MVLITRQRSAFKSPLGGGRGNPFFQVGAWRLMYESNWMNRLIKLASNFFEGSVSKKVPSCCPNAPYCFLSWCKYEACGELIPIGPLFVYSSRIVARATCL